MKKTFQLLSFLTILFLASCGKKDESGGSGTPVEKPTARVSKANIIADNFDETVFSAVDKNGNDITTQCTFFVNNIQVVGTKYSTDAAGTINVKATLNGAESASITVTATSPGVSRHSQKVLAEDYTGAWCQFCPRVAKSLDDLSTADPNIIPIAVHNADALAYPLEGQMRTKWGVSGFPTVVVNRNFKWNESNGTITSQLLKWAPLGLSIESSIAGSTISGRVRTQFNVTTTIPMTITIMLLENGRVLPQSNAYNGTAGSPFFGLGNPIANYVHNHILRVASTSIFGDPIPNTATVKDNIHDTNYSFNASAYDVTKCDIVAVVSYADGVTGRVGVLNAQKTKAGVNKAFN